VRLLFSIDFTECASPAHSQAQRNKDDPHTSRSIEIARRSRLTALKVDLCRRTLLPQPRPWRALRQAPAGGKITKLDAKIKREMVSLS